jgi:hypothetical protein
MPAFAAQCGQAAGAVPSLAGGHRARRLTSFVANKIAWRGGVSPQTVGNWRRRLV